MTTNQKQCHDLFDSPLQEPCIQQYHRMNKFSFQHQIYSLYSVQSLNETKLDNKKRPLKHNRNIIIFLAVVVAE